MRAWASLVASEAGRATRACRLFHVGVRDVEAALQRAEELGGTRVMGPARSPSGLVVGNFKHPKNRHSHRRRRRRITPLRPSTRRCEFPGSPAIGHCPAPDRRRPMQEENPGVRDCSIGGISFVQQQRRCRRRMVPSSANFSGRRGLLVRYPRPNRKRT